MNVQQSLRLIPNVEGPSVSHINKKLQETNTSFGETLNQAISDVNSLQQEASKAIDHMVTGETTDLHEVMIAAEKAKTSFDLLMEIRNKAVDVYRELMRIQV